MAIAAIGDPQDCRPLGWCSRCGGELYRGEDAYWIWGQWICLDCLAAFAVDYFRPWQVRIGTAEVGKL